MKQHRLLNQRRVSFISALLIAGFALVLTIGSGPEASTHIQDGLVTIKLKNESDWPVAVKVVGPTARVINLNPSGIHRFGVKPGDYYLFYHYLDGDQKHRYLRTGLFTARAGSDEIAITADMTPTYDSYVSAHQQRAWLLESDFTKPPGWPEAGVPIESQPTFKTLKLLVVIEELDLGDRDDERNYVTGVVKGALNRIVLREVLPQLRRQGFRVTYTAANAPKIVPETFAEPTMLITYNEHEGRTYLGMKGISIKCDVSLYLPGSKNSEPAWQDEVWGVNSDEVRVNFLNANGSFRGDSLKNLKAEFAEFVIDLTGWKAK